MAYKVEDHFQSASGVATRIIVTAGIMSVKIEILGGSRLSIELTEREARSLRNLLNEVNPPDAR